MKATSNQKSKKSKFVENKNLLETIGSIGAQTADTFKNEAKLTTDEFFKQLLGQQRALQEKRSGDLNQGKAVDIEDVVSGRQETKQKIDEQIFFERRLFNEERQETQKKIQELRMRLQVVHAEAMRMVNSTQKLTEQVKIAVIQGSVDASEYQINFFENIIKLISNFRKKIDSAVTWLQGNNSRAQKKNYWSQYKKKGSSFLLSGESYSQRSAG